MHAYSSYTILLKGETKELEHPLAVLRECFKGDKYNTIPEFPSGTSNSLEISISGTYEVVFLDDIVDMAKKMAAAAKKISFSIGGTIDTSESCGQYMDFDISYEGGVLTVESSYWYALLLNISYEQFCEDYYEDKPDAPIISMEEFNRANYILDKGDVEFVEEVPLECVDIIKLDDDVDDDSSSREDILKVDVDEALRKLRNHEMPREEIESFLLDIPWKGYIDVVEEMLEAIERRDRVECIFQAPEIQNEDEDQFWDIESINKKNVRITKYKGHQPVVIIPQMIAGKTVTEIGDYAFSAEQPHISKNLKMAREGITKILFDDSVKKIGRGVFQGLKNLETIVLSKSMKALPDETFKECKSLKYVNIPKSVTRLGIQVFWGCESLLLAYLPDCIKSIRNTHDAGGGLDIQLTFGECSSLKKAKMPNGIKVMGDHFNHCIELEEVILPTELKTIRNSFNGCKKLSQIELPDGLEKIGNYSFSNCRLLRTLQIPSSVNTIGKSAFYGIDKLTLVLKEGSPIIRFAERNKLPYIID